jgi:predicted kinase
MNKKDSFFDYLQTNWKDVFGRDPYDENDTYNRVLRTMEKTDNTVYITVPDIKEVIIMRGLPGSGKSTFVEENFPGTTVCSADNFFLNDDEDYVFVPYKISEAHQDCWGHYIDALFRKEERVVVDNTNMCSWEYANYVKLATKKGYTVRIICMSSGLHDETSVKTLAKRNSHGVNAETIARMKDRYEPDVAEELA